MRTPDDIPVAIQEAVKTFLLNRSDINFGFCYGMLKAYCDLGIMTPRKTLEIMQDLRKEHMGSEYRAI